MNNTGPKKNPLMPKDFAGGTLKYVYPGTFDKLPIFTDEKMTHRAKNPVQIDAKGSTQDVYFKGDADVIVNSSQGNMRVHIGERFE